MFYLGFVEGENLMVYIRTYYPHESWDIYHINW